MKDERKYVRVYYSVVDDERFADVYHNPTRLGTWLQLLLVADAMYPAPAPIPAYISRSAFRVLVQCGLIELAEHGHYRVHGLASEREMRAQSGRNAAAVRWQSDRNADPMPRRAETSRDEQRRDEQRGSRPRARDATAAGPSPEEVAFDWLASHGAGFPEGNGLYPRLVDLSRRHGAGRVVAMFEELSTESPARLTGRQYVLGAENRLDRIPVAGPSPEPTEEERKRAAIAAFRGAGA